MAETSTGQTPVIERLPDAHCDGDGDVKATRLGLKPHAQTEPGCYLSLTGDITDSDVPFVDCETESYDLTVENGSAFSRRRNTLPAGLAGQGRHGLRRHLITAAVAVAIAGAAAAGHHFRVAKLRTVNRAQKSLLEAKTDAIIALQTRVEELQTSNQELMAEQGGREFTEESLDVLGVAFIEVGHAATYVEALRQTIAREQASRQNALSYAKADSAKALTEAEDQVDNVENELVHIKEELTELKNQMDALILRLELKTIHAPDRP